MNILPLVPTDEYYKDGYNIKDIKENNENDRERKISND